MTKEVAQYLLAGAASIYVGSLSVVVIQWMIRRVIRAVKGD
jgi:hypothetical protein